MSNALLHQEVSASDDTVIEDYGTCEKGNDVTARIQALAAMIRDAAKVHSTGINHPSDRLPCQIDRQPAEIDVHLFETEDYRGAKTTVSVCKKCFEEASDLNHS